MSEKNEETVEETRSEEKTEARVVAEPAPQLQAEDRASLPHAQSLTDAFRRQGWPAETATISYGEYRAVSLASGGTIDDLAPVRRDGVALGHDARWVYPIVPQIAVGSDVTSVQVLRQSDRSLLGGTALDQVVRPVDSTDPKAEVDSEIEVDVEQLRQVAAVQRGVPNVVLETDAVSTVVENDLRLQHSEGLDSLVLAGIADSGFHDPTTNPLLVNVRLAAGSIEAAGYSPGVVVLRPSDAIALDTLRVAGTASEDYVFAPQLAPRTLYGMQVRVSKTIPAPAVLDPSAFGKLYLSSVSLSRFEENAGATNSSTIRLENHAAFGVERLDAAIRVAAS